MSAGHHNVGHRLGHADLTAVGDGGLLEGHAYVTECVALVKKVCVELLVLWKGWGGKGREWWAVVGEMRVVATEEVGL